MKAILSEAGFAFSATEYINLYGNELFLKLQKKYTIRTVDRTTKIPQVTKLFKLIKCGDTKIIEFPRFVMNELVSTKPSAKTPISNVDNQLPIHQLISNIEYIGKSNLNQQIVVNHIVDSFTNNASITGVTLKLMAGCHAKDTDILMYDGGIKKVQDIGVGDQLMGDDSTPRNVLNLVRGKDTMYRITNFNGETYNVNKDHILCLKYTNKNCVRYSKACDRYISYWFNKNNIKLEAKRFKTEEDAKTYLSKKQEDYIVEISVREYLTLAKSWQKDLKEYKTLIEFPTIDLPIDPYMIGYWLGDGHSSISAITSQDAPVLKYFAYNLGQYNCYLKYQNKYAYRINGSGTGLVNSNEFANNLDKLNLINNKHIPYIYKCNSRENRLKLLAGLIDSDGHLTNDNCTIEFTQSMDNEKLFDDVLYLARSLGFSCNKNIKKTSWTHKGVKKEGLALRMYISGEGLDQLPVLCIRKKPNSRKQIKDVLVSQIKIEELENGDYYGFQVDKNHRYVMGNFAVTHNCGKSFVAKDIIGKMKLKTLIVVPNTYLLDQWVNLLRQYFPTTKIGTLYGKEKNDGDIIVGIINTVSELQSFVVTEKKPIPNIGKTLKYMKVSHTIQVNDILKAVGLTIFDESHMYVSKEFRKVFQRIWSRYTIGLSATPDIREDKLDIIHQLWLGPILDAETLEGFNISQDSFYSDAKMIEYHAYNEHCKFNVRDDGMIDYSSIVESIITDPYRNQLIIDQIIELMQKDHYTFVFSDRRNHLECLYDLLQERCIELNEGVMIELPESEKKVILYGGASEDTIDQAKRISTVIFTTYAYSSTGVSITKMNALVLTTPRRSNMKQIINRVFRLGSDQRIRRTIVDIVDAKLPIKRQVQERIKAYKERGCDILKTKIIACDLDNAITNR